MHSKELPKIFESDRENSLPYQINFTDNLLRTVMNRRFQKNEIDITPEQLMILNYLNEQKKGVTMQSVSEVLLRDNSAITRAADSLIKKKYIKKTSTKSDRRKRLISITDEGKEMYSKAKKVAFVHVTEALQGLSSKQIAETFVYLNIIQENMIRIKEEL